MNVIVFEDNLVNRLFPITAARPAYAISCGSYRLIDGLRQLGRFHRGLVRTHLSAIQHADFHDWSNHGTLPDDSALVVNARNVPAQSHFELLGGLAAMAKPAAVWYQDSLAAAVLPNEQARQLPNDRQLFASQVVELARQLPRADFDLPLMEYPHDVVRYNMQVLPENIQQRLATGNFEEIRDGVFAAPGATIAEFVVSHTREGPILLDEHVSVGSHCFLQGPAYIGPHSRIIEHAAIKDLVSVGHTAKIGGEVEASVIEPYTNKQHHGFLGHSYLGSWINLGAGTCNSDLKNTYGEVKMDYGPYKVATSMQFVGCIMGDYAKSAINTGIFTGKVIGACSMVYGFVTTNVPSFVNYARLFGQVTELPPDVMIATQKRMFARRRVEQRSCDVQLIFDMFELTKGERQLAGEPLSL